MIFGYRLAPQWELPFYIRTKLGTYFKLFFMNYFAKNINTFMQARTGTVD